MTALVIIVIILALVFGFINGVHDSSNVVATMISSRAFTPRVALGMTAVAEFSGPFIFGVAVAKTIGEEFVSAEVIGPQVLLAALIGSIAWNLFTWYIGFPSSSLHALVGGLIGAVLVGAGPQAILIPGLEKMLVALFLSPFLGILVGFIVLRVVLLLAWNATPRVNKVFKRGQILTALTLALSHGANDAQKTMGVITLALISGGYLSAFAVPGWVVLACAAVLAAGTLVGGWKLIRTLGGKFFKIRPVDGFSSQLASATVIVTSSLVGLPVSTTQVVSSTIMGVGAAERISKVRWGVVKDMAIAWLMTIPASALVSAGVYWLVNLIAPAK